MTSCPAQLTGSMTLYLNNLPPRTTGLRFVSLWASRSADHSVGSSARGHILKWSRRLVDILMTIWLRLLSCCGRAACKAVQLFPLSLQLDGGRSGGMADHLRGAAAVWRGLSQDELQRERHAEVKRAATVGVAVHIVTTVQYNDAKTCLSNFAALFADCNSFVATLLSADVKGTLFNFPIFLGSFPLLGFPRKTFVLLWQPGGWN